MHVSQIAFTFNNNVFKIIKIIKINTHVYLNLNKSLNFLR